jgi:hypothetical protein
MKLRIPKIGFAAWLSIVILVVGLPLFLAVRKGYVNSSVATP